MLKINHFLGLFVCSIAILTGCRTTEIPIKITTPGEFNLSGVSKIAIVDFNSIKTDKTLGLYSIDDETRQVVQHMVASEFSKSKLYEVCNLDIEKVLLDENNVKLENRFDAILYGKIWWEVSKEYRYSYPYVFNLKRWIYHKYDTGNKDMLGNPIYATAKLITSTEDVFEELKYRSVLANLMLSLTLYKVDSEGKVNKVVDTFAIASYDFILNNGCLIPHFNQLGKDMQTQLESMKEETEKGSIFSGLLSKKTEAKNVDGKFKVTQHSNTIPSHLQSKIMLSNKLVSLLTGKIATSTETINIKCDIDDAAVFNLVRDEAYNAARNYIVTHLYKEFGKNLCGMVDPLLEYEPYITFIMEDEEDEYDEDDVVDFVEENADYLYILALCEEATGETEQALYTYRYLFNKVPTKEIAEGISRCLLSIGMADKVSEKAKAMRKAARKSRVQ